MAKRLQTLAQLKKAADQRRAVVAPEYRGFRLPRPAAFVLFFPGAEIFRMFESGLYLYESKKKEKAK